MSGIELDCRSLRKMKLRVQTRIARRKNDIDTHVKTKEYLRGSVTKKVPVPALVSYLL